MPDPGPSPQDDLPYRVELWRDGRAEVERVLARAASAELAQAIFRAVQVEYPKRRITLSKGPTLVRDSAG
jgi:hypothetical protein